jgi:hypothetical protein
MLNFEKYFYQGHDLVLKHIVYQCIDSSASEEAKLICRDKLEVEDTDERRINLIFTRVLKFEPSFLYELTVSFGFSLFFVKENMHEVNWNEIDIVKELLDDQSGLLENIMSRASLLISQITSCSGYMPIITPPVFMN